MRKSEYYPPGIAWTCELSPSGFCNAKGCGLGSRCVLRKSEKRKASGLTDAEERDIKLWFGWGALLDYVTTPRAYLREALRPDRRTEFLAMSRPLRRAILRFVITEHEKRTT